MTVKYMEWLTRMKQDFENTLIYIAHTKAIQFQLIYEYYMRTFVTLLTFYTSTFENHTLLT